MSSNLKVNTILPSVGSNIGLGTNGGNLNVDGGCKVQVGTALTLGHTVGVQFATQNLHSAGFEVNQINASGIITATSFSGSGANLTSLPAANLTGTLPAISGANLTSLPIGGSNALSLNDNVNLNIGTGNDGSLFNSGSYIFLKNHNGNVAIQASGTGSVISLQKYNNSDIGLQYVVDGKIQLNYDNVSMFETESRGAFVKKGNGSDTTFTVGSTDASGVRICLDGDSNGDAYGNDYAFLQHDSSGDFIISADNPAGNSNLIFKSGNSSERFRIADDGDIGVGVASPDGRFHIMGGNLGGAGSVTANSAGNLLVLESNTSQGMSILTANDERANIYFGTTGTNGDIEAGIQYAHEAVSTTADRRSMIFRSGGGTRMRIQNQSLRVGDSTHSNAGGRLQVVEERGGNQYNDCNAYFETNANDWNIKTYYNTTGSHYHMAFMEQGSHRGDIRGSDGSNVVYNSGSDYRWKENVVRITGTEGIEICKKLQPSKYNWIDNRIATGQINTVDGFIAHEVEESGVLGAVTGEKDAVNEDGSIKGQMLDYGQMTPVLAAAIKGLIDKVETLETKVAALEGS